MSTSLRHNCTQFVSKLLSIVWTVDSYPKIPSVRPCHKKRPPYTFQISETRAKDASGAHPSKLLSLPSRLRCCSTSAASLRNRCKAVKLDVTTPRQSEPDENNAPILKIKVICQSPFCTAPIPFCWIKHGPISSCALLLFCSHT